MDRGTTYTTYDGAGSGADQQYHAYQGHPHPFPDADKEAEDEKANQSEGSKDKENGEREKLTQPMAELEDTKDPVVMRQNEIINKGTPSSELEIALSESLKRKELHIARLTSEVLKLKKFISKRKQTYKRKRKDDGAPTRPLSGYNLFIKEKFEQLSKENERALMSDSTDATLKRVAPSSLILTTGNAWKELSAEEKAKYDERAKSDRKRYEEQMAEYQPPDKHDNRKRNKTAYNLFFSQHVLRLKQTESGVPSERGSVARLVGTAWKQLSPDDRAYYEREADKFNGMQPAPKDGDDSDEDEDSKRLAHAEYQNYPPADMHMQQHMPMHQGTYDPRHHHGYYPPHMYGPPPPYGYDYSQHHQRHQQARAQGYQQQGYPPPPRHPGYEG